MTVIYLSNCPPALQGDLTKWLMEIATGVYVGRVSARVRDKLWERIVETCKGGRAVLVFSANNEQRMDFRVHGETWEPIDFDGLKLMLRPSPARLALKRAKAAGEKKLGFSNAARFQKAKRYAGGRGKSEAPVAMVQMSLTGEGEKMSEAADLDTYVVLDIETTGFKPGFAEMTEIGAVKVAGGQVVDTFQSLVKIKRPVPPAITQLTGITDGLLAAEGKPLDEVLNGLTVFVEGLPMVAHNAPFDMSFLNAGFAKCGLRPLVNRVEDTLVLARRRCKNLKSYKLQALALHFGLDMAQFELDGYRLHRSLGDCMLTHLVFEKLMDLGGFGL